MPLASEILITNIGGNRFEKEVVIDSQYVNVIESVADIHNSGEYKMIIQQA